MEARNNIFLISDRARSERAKGKDIVDGTVGMMLLDDGTLARLPSVTKALEKVKNDPLEYPPVGGYQDFLDAALKWIWGDLADRVRTDTSLVEFASNGGTGALYLAFCYAKAQGYEVLYPGIGWPNYQTIAKAAEVPYKPYALFDESGRFNIESIRRIMARDRKLFKGFLILVNDPCENPTGYSLTKEECEAVYNLARDGASELNTRADIIWDAAYLDFAEHRPSWIEMSLDTSTTSKTFVAFSASKSFGAYGLRIGALFGLFDPKKEDKTRNMVNLLQGKAYGIYSTPESMGMRAVTEVMKRSNAEAVKEGIDSWKKIVNRRSKAVIEALDKEGIAYLPHSEGFYLTVKCPVNADEVEDELESRGVFLGPVVMNMIRISLASVRAEDSEMIAKALKEAFEAIQAKTK